MYRLANGLPGAIQGNTLKKTGMHDAQLARALVKSANPMIIIDRSASIMWCNDAYSIMADTSIDALLKKKPYSLAPSIENTKFLNEVWSVLMSGSIWKGELTERGKDGKIINVDAVMTPLDDASGKPSLFMLFLHDITERKSQYDVIWKMANHDRLTGLANRNFFLSMLDHTMSMSQRNGTLSSLLYLDLDGFKAANDTFGHDIGDLILRETAEVLKANVRRSDFVARLGGDEFVCILSEVGNPQDSGEVASQIIRALHLMTNVGGKTVRIGASIGIATYPNDSMDAEGLIKCADTAMYAAKHAGKNCWRQTSDLQIEPEDNKTSK